MPESVPSAVAPSWRVRSVLLVVLASGWKDGVEARVVVARRVAARIDFMAAMVDGLWCGMYFRELVYSLESTGREIVMRGIRTKNKPIPRWVQNVVRLERLKSI